ncbi:hypothetical protein BCV70DRAFT_54328 [Testicularia cyperi]|uniref:Uncharacterized protein n=1 Tax=Testicularia cyperi TaxID=1882483 RepID=A0A317XUI8_9BASI|nr:hypothetical protein BCV70DRAFT_54328 [Testicularia cyperi]
MCNPRFGFEHRFFHTQQLMSWSKSIFLSFPSIFFYLMAASKPRSQDTHPCLPVFFSLFLLFDLPSP